MIMMKMKYTFFFKFSYYLFYYKSDDDDNYKPFSTARKSKRTKKFSRMKKTINQDYEPDFEDAEISDQELEIFLKKTASRSRNSAAHKRKAIKKKYLFNNNIKKYKKTIFRTNNKDSSFSLLLSWKHKLHLTHHSIDEKVAK